MGAQQPFQLHHPRAVPAGGVVSFFIWVADFAFADFA